MEITVILCFLVKVVTSLNKIATPKMKTVILVLGVISVLQGTLGVEPEPPKPKPKPLKCYICNSAFKDFQGIAASKDEELWCKYPNKYPGKIKEQECSYDVLQALSVSWMDGRWNEDRNTYPQHVTQPEAGTHEPWQFGSEPQDGWTLKCMTEELPKGSKPWLQYKDANFTQTVRFCEYRKDKEVPPCDKRCTPEQKTKTGCYLCCTGDKCNVAGTVNPTWTIVGLATLVVTAAMWKKVN